MKPNRYTIRTVEDFFTVPLDRIEPFMLDFVQFLAFGHELPKNNVLELKCDRFVWIDDGKTGLSEIIVEARE